MPSAVTTPATSAPMLTFAPFTKAIATPASVECASASPENARPLCTTNVPTTPPTTLTISSTASARRMNSNW